MYKDFTKNEAQFKKKVLALKDSVELLRGKWKICILLNLSVRTNLRFKDLLEEVDSISPKVLSKELQELEEHLLVSRTVVNSKPVTVNYAITDHAKDVYPIIDALIDFGILHRKKVIEKSE